MIKIIGAGISGLTCAIKLAKYGNKVKVIEQNNFVGKHVGDNIQAIRNYELNSDLLEYFKKQGIQVTNFKPIYSIDKYAPSGKKMKVHDSKNPLFYVLRRGPHPASLEYQLYEEALNQGVIIEFEKRKNLLEGDVIAVNSIFSNVWAYGATFNAVDVDPEKILFFMDNTYCPNGYIYLLPFGKHEVSIAATSFDITSPLPILFNRFIQENKIVKEILQDSIFVNNFSGYAYHNVPKTAEIKNKMFIGSSAGFLDSARGFGIKFALKSAHCAAKAISEKKSYDTLWKQSFEKELLEGFSRRLMLNSMDNNDYEKLILKNKVKISDYTKVPQGIDKKFDEKTFNKELDELRKRFDLKKIFNN